MLHGETIISFDHQVHEGTYVFFCLVMYDPIDEWELIRTSFFSPFDLFQAFIEPMSEPAGNWMSALYNTTSPY
jgi:hypothetical protein